MNREILFRGKRVDNGEWVEGDLIHGVGWKKDKLYILPIVENLAYLPGCHPLDGFEIVTETVGQFTGLPDKNGKRIFEHDLVKREFLNGYLEKVTVIYTIKWGKWSWIKRTENGIVFSFDSIECKEYEVIGSIFDNPDLLKINTLQR